MKFNLRNIIYRLSDAIELPLNEVLYDDSICMSGRREVIFYGVNNICNYREQTIVLKLKCDKVCIRGSGLRIEILRKSAVGIRGKIDSVEFGGNDCDFT